MNKVFRKPYTKSLKPSWDIRPVKDFNTITANRLIAKHGKKSPYVHDSTTSKHILNMLKKNIHFDDINSFKDYLNSYSTNGFYVSDHPYISAFCFEPFYSKPELINEL